MIDLKEKVVDCIATQNTGLSDLEIYNLVEIPPNPEMGDYAFPCFKLSKILKKSPNIISQEMVNDICKENLDFFLKIESNGGYVNFFVKDDFYIDTVIGEVLEKKEFYASSNNKTDKTIVIDYSSTNIAKPFHIGHIRSTLIGNVIKNIYNYLGYKTIGVNHLGDYGTQFGKIIAAYKLWGNKEKINADPINELLDLYVRYNEECKENEEMLIAARDYFSKLEHKDEEALNLWNWFKEISLREFDIVYKKLKINFDSFRGEAYYSQYIDSVVKELEDKKLLVESEGCKVINLDKYNLPPAIIIKSNNSSTYITRDIATAIIRKRDYNFYKNIYVVGSPQKLHFEQLKAIITEMGYDWANDCVHVPFGMVSLKDDLEGKSLKFSTREGNVIFLNDVLDKSIEKTLELIEVKNPELENKQEISKIIGIGAVIFQELFNTRVKDYSFDWNNVLNFEGESGPYIQYTIVRAKSILNKNNFQEDSLSLPLINSYMPNDDEVSLFKCLYKFKYILNESAEKFEPSILARYIIEVSKYFNKFYNSSSISKQEKNIKQFRLCLTYCTKIVIEIGFKLMGIDIPDKM